MQKYTLLLKSFTGNTTSGSSQLELVDNYYLYRQKNGGGVVDEFNVMTYLDDPDNSIVAKSFFSYLTGNTNTEQFKEIFYNNKKLSNVFNQYYNTSVVTNTGTSTAVINLELTGTTATTIYNYYGNWNGNSNSYLLLTGTPTSIQGETDLIIKQNKLLSITSENSYYIPVNINLEEELIGQINFSQYAQDYILNGKQIVQGFVDINFKTDYTNPWNTSWKRPEKTTKGASGIEVVRYNGIFDRVPNFSKLIPTSRGSIVTIGPIRPLVTNYALRFIGYFYVPTDDTYVFYLNSDDGSLMYIGDLLLINNDGNHPPTEKSATIKLLSGYHKFEIHFFQKSVTDELQLFYSNSTVLKTLVSADRLSQ